MLLEKILTWDEELLFTVNRSLVHPWMDRLMATLSSTVVWVCLAGVILAWVIYKKKWNLLWLYLAIIVGFALNDLIVHAVLKPLIGRLRPCAYAEHSFRLLLGCGGKYSFPSNHAANAMYFTILTFWFRKKLVPIYILIAISVGFSRVYLGVHYPLDVLAGFVVGGMFGTLTYFVYQKIRQKSASKL